MSATFVRPQYDELFLYPSNAEYDKQQTKHKFTKNDDKIRHSSRPPKFQNSTINLPKNVNISPVDSDNFAKNSVGSDSFKRKINKMINKNGLMESMITNAGQAGTETLSVTEGTENRLEEKIPDPQFPGISKMIDNDGSVQPIAADAGQQLETESSSGAVITENKIQEKKRCAISSKDEQVVDIDTVRRAMGSFAKDQPEKQSVKKREKGPPSDTEVTTEKPKEKTFDFEISDLSDESEIITEKEMEDLREYVRMLKGLPPTRKPRRKLLDITKTPSIPPRMNKATGLRTQYIRYISREPMQTRCQSETFTALDEKKSLDSLKELVTYYKKTTKGPYHKFNRGFEMRYRHNRGSPIMPSSFRKNFETYNKPLFQIPKRLHLPKKYLWPVIRDRNVISYLGIGMDTNITSQAKKTVQPQKKMIPVMKKKKQVQRSKPILPKEKSKKGIFASIFGR